MKKEGRTEKILGLAITAVIVGVLLLLGPINAVDFVNV